jgi:hypothetical protein
MKKLITILFLSLYLHESRAQLVQTNSNAWDHTPSTVDNKLLSIDAVTDAGGYVYQLLQNNFSTELIKRDPAGTVIWKKNLPSYNQKVNMPIGVKFLDNQTLAVVSNNNYDETLPISLNNPNPEKINMSHGFEIYTVKTNSGTLLSHKQHSAPLNTARDFIIHAGTIFVLGDVANVGQSNLTLFKFDNTGEHINTYTYPTVTDAPYKFGVQLEMDLSGYLYFLGYDSPNAYDETTQLTDTRAFYGRLNYNGTLDWVHSVGFGDFGETQKSTRPVKMSVTNESLFIGGYAHEMNYTEPETDFPTLSFIKDNKTATRNTQLLFDEALIFPDNKQLIDFKIIDNRIFSLINYELSGLVGLRNESWLRAYNTNMLNPTPEKVHPINSGVSGDASFWSYDMYYNAPYLYVLGGQQIDIPSTDRQQFINMFQITSEIDLLTTQTITPANPHEYPDKIIANNYGDIYTTGITGNLSFATNKFDSKFNAFHYDLEPVASTITNEAANNKDKLVKAQLVGSNQLVLTNTYNPYNSPNNISTLKSIDPLTGNTNWTTTDNSKAISFIADPSGNVYVLSAEYLTKYSPSGALEWQTPLSDPSFMSGDYQCLAINPLTSKILIGGRAFFDTDYEAIILEIAPSGYLSNIIRPNEIDKSATSIVTKNDGSYTVLLTNELIDLNEPPTAIANGDLILASYEFNGNLRYRRLISSQTYFIKNAIHLIDAPTYSGDRFVIAYCQAEIMGGLTPVPLGQTRLAVIDYTTGNILINNNISPIHYLRSLPLCLYHSPFNSNYVIFGGTEYDLYRITRDANLYTYNIVSGYVADLDSYGYMNNFIDQINSIAFDTHYNKFIAGSTQETNYNRNFNTTIGLVLHYDAFGSLASAVNYNNYNYQNEEFSFVSEYNGSVLLNGSSTEINNSDHVFASYSNFTPNYFRQSATKQEEENIEKEKMETEHSLTLFPNPSRDEITIKAEIDCVLKIYSIDGKLLKTETINEGVNKLKPELASGLYYFVTTKDDAVVSKTKVAIIN